MSEYNTEFARKIAARLPLIRGSKQAAIDHLEGRLSGWTGDTRRDGDTPKEFWQEVLDFLKS